MCVCVCVCVRARACVRTMFTNTLALSSTDMQQPDVEMAVGCGGERRLSPRSGLEKERESLAESLPYVEEAGKHLWAHPGFRADDRTPGSKAEQRSGDNRQPSYTKVGLCTFSGHQVTLLDVTYPYYLLH